MVDMIQPKCLRICLAGWLKTMGKSSEMQRFFLIECIAVIFFGALKLGSDVWGGRPRKRSFGMCGCRRHVWSEVWVAVGRWKWGKSKGDIWKCMEMGRPMHFESVTYLPRGATSMSKKSVFFLNIYLNRSKVNMGLIRSSVISHANIALWVNEWKRNWPASDLTIRWFVPI